tara:strand:- start:520 stop:999 length:480 start_codon:yes stop_codon:yes gene_type:complete
VFIRADASHEAIVNNLLQLYMHDMSEWFGTVTDNRGRYNFIQYRPSDIVYLAIDDETEKPAGLAIVATPGNGSYDLEEFFLMRRFRHQGMGERFVAHILSDLRGDWIVRFFEGNLPAVPFWRKALSAYTSDVTEERESVEGFDWRYFQFESPGRRQDKV